MIKQDLLTPNKYSRPKTKLKSVKKIVLHWVANPNTTAKQNRNYFEKRKNGLDGYGSAHYIIDDKEILQCIPDNEMAYHVGSEEYTDYGLNISSYPNARTLGVEFCHNDWEGEPTGEVYNKIVYLLFELCKKYELNPIKDICRHFDITGKVCPKYYTNNVSSFWKLKEDVKKLLT